MKLQRLGIARSLDSESDFVTYPNISSGPLIRVESSYDYLLRLHEANTDNEVECLATYTDPMDGKQKTCHHFQSQDTTNRTSTCESCATVSCIPCGRIPEHHTETCSQYQSRMHREHGEEEAATRSALESGYSGIEQGSKKLYVTPKQVQHRPVRCPGAGCGILIERMKGGGCGHMICPLCKSHFCSMCGAHYFGVGGVYDVGNAAHAAECTYAKRKVEDWRFERKRKIDRVEGRGEEEMGSAKSRKGADVLANEDGAVGKSARKDDRVK